MYFIYSGMKIIFVILRVVFQRTIVDARHNFCIELQQQEIEDEIYPTSRLEMFFFALAIIGLII